MVQIVYKPNHVRILLGDISRSTYRRIVDQGLLPYTRLTPGGQIVHLPEHLKEYEDYLREQTVRRGGRK